MKHLIYFRGYPGVGKTAVAKVLQEKLGWRLFCFHDLKNAVYNVVQEHRIPRLMDELTVPVIRFMMDRGDNVIYVRPSPDRETVENIQNLAAQYPDYEFTIIRLNAPYETLLKRVMERNDPYKINTQEDLDSYINSREVADIEGELVINADTSSPEVTAQAILSKLELQESLPVEV